MEASPRSWSSALCRYARNWISGNGQEPDLARADGEPEDGLLVEQRVEDASSAERLPQPHGHAVHAALLRDVLAEHEHLGVFPHQIGERGADAVTERPRLLGIGGRRRISVPLRFVGHATGALRRDRRHDFAARRELGSR